MIRTLTLGILIMVPTLVCAGLSAPEAAPKPLTLERPETLPPTESADEAIRKEVERAFDGLVAATRSLDVEAYLSYFDRDHFSGLDEDGTVLHSLDEFASAYREFAPAIDAYESLDFHRVKITVLNPTTAVLVNEYEAKVRLVGGESVFASGGGTQVWSRIDGAWKLVSVSSSARLAAEQ